MAEYEELMFVTLARIDKWPRLLRGATKGCDINLAGIELISRALPKIQSAWSKFLILEVGVCEKSQR